MASTVLVAEDEALIADDIQRTLVKLGYDVPYIAATGREAIEATEALHPELVLMDIKLQGAMDGIEAARIIRSACHVPVVYLTSHSDEATLSRAKETQPYGYILKPFADRELRSAIEIAVHKHALDARLAQRERWFSATLQSLGEAVIATDRYETVTFMNTVAEKLTGWSCGEAIGHKIDEVFCVVDAGGSRMRSPISLALASSFTVQLPTFSKLLAKTGHRVEVGDIASPIVDETGAVLGGTVVFREETERRRLEERLSQSERLASIGMVAASLAHEIMNPLAYVIANLGMCISRLTSVVEHLGPAKPDPSPDEQCLREGLELLKLASEGSDRVLRIAQDVRRLARGDDGPRTLLDLPDLLESAVTVTSRALCHEARLNRQYGTTPYVEANEAQLTQVFTNLLTNALQAVSGAGVTRRDIQLVTYTDDVGRAVVEIKDSGPGIRSEVLPRIFEPFFTTKGASGGMGLGLAICRRIVLGIGGMLEVDTREGRGSTFRVVLPPATVPVSDAAQVAEACGRA